MSINIRPSPPQAAQVDRSQAEELGAEVLQKPVLDDENSCQPRLEAGPQIGVKETKPARLKRTKVREIKQQAQTGEQFLSLFVRH